jgi:hypothetical protein
VSERAHILERIREGQISVNEGAKLLDALHSDRPAAPTPPRPGTARWLHVRVTNLESGKPKVNVNLPLGLVRAGLKVGARYSAEVNEIDWDELLLAIQEGAAGKLVEVEDQEDGERVEVYVD